MLSQAFKLSDKTMLSLACKFPDKTMLSRPCKFPDKTMLSRPCKLSYKTMLSRPCKFPDKTILSRPCKLSYKTMLSRPFKFLDKTVFPHTAECLGWCFQLTTIFSFKSSLTVKFYDRSILFPIRQKTKSYVLFLEISQFTIYKISFLTTSLTDPLANLKYDY